MSPSGVKFLLSSVEPPLNGSIDRARPALGTLGLCLMSRFIRTDEAIIAVRTSLTRNRYLSLTLFSSVTVVG